MPYEDKTVLGSGSIRKASTDQVKGELAPGYAVKQGELVAFMSTGFANNLTGKQLTVSGVTIANPAVFTTLAHGYVAGDAVEFRTSGALTNFTTGTIYYVTATSLTATTFTLAATSGGTAISTAAGSTSGTHTVAKAGNYAGLIIGSSSIDTALYSAAKTEFRTQLLGAAAFAKTSSDPDRTVVVFTHPVVEFLTDDSAAFGVGAAVKLKENSTKYTNPGKWTLATFGTDELGVVVEQAPIRLPDYGYAASVTAGTTYSLSALAAPVKVSAVLRTRFN